MMYTWNGLSIKLAIGFCNCKYWLDSKNFISYIKSVWKSFTLSMPPRHKRALFVIVNLCRGKDSTYRQWGESLDLLLIQIGLETTNKWSLVLHQALVSNHVEGSEVMIFDIHIYCNNYDFIRFNTAWILLCHQITTWLKNLQIKS